MRYALAQKSQEQEESQPLAESLALKQEHVEAQEVSQLLAQAQAQEVELAQPPTLVQPVAQEVLQPLEQLEAQLLAELLAEEVSQAVSQELEQPLSLSLSHDGPDCARAERGATMVSTAGSSSVSEPTNPILRTKRRREARSISALRSSAVSSSRRARRSFASVITTRSSSAVSFNSALSNTTRSAMLLVPSACSKISAAVRLSECERLRCWSKTTRSSPVCWMSKRSVRRRACDMRASGGGST